MNRHLLFEHCKTGNLASLKVLVEEMEIDVNTRDTFDSTPLYYACLCGHIKIVEYLLKNGSVCEANTFDGERCLYGALNDDIRNMLKQYVAAPKKLIRRDIYLEFLRKMSETRSFCDITFNVQNKTIYAHRCILQVRSIYFNQMLNTKWLNKTTINISHPMVTPNLFKFLLQYLYTGNLKISIDEVQDLLILAKQCQLKTLILELEMKIKSVRTFNQCKPNTAVTMISLDSNSFLFDLQADFAVLAKDGLPSDLTVKNDFDLELPFAPQREYHFHDLTVEIDHLIFKCHKIFLAGRSDYFRTVIEDHFGETSVDEDNITHMRLSDISPAIFSLILSYIYQNFCDLDPESTLDVLVAADIYLLPGLKTQCGGYLSKNLSIENAVDYLRTARLFNLPKLEDSCSAFMATYIEHMVVRPDFVQLTIEDANAIKDRQSVDSIMIIDDIRYHLTNFVTSFSDMYDAKRRLSIINDLLIQLNIEA